MESSNDALDAPADPFGVGGRSIRLRVGLGGGIVLVVVAAGIAVLLTALLGHPSTAASSFAGSTSASYRSSSTSSPSAAPSAADQANLGGGNGSTALVQVSGQVVKPGLYELSTGSRVVDAIAAADGFTDNADQSGLNLAQIVADGQQVVVPVKGAHPPAPATSPDGTATVNINTADATALETLDGIGPALAARILAYRTAHGGFRSVGDLQNVTGIGPKKFAAIKNKVSI